MQGADGQRISFHMLQHISLNCYFQSEVCASFFPVGDNLSASWLQSSRKYRVQRKKTREMDGRRMESCVCVEEETK